MHHHMPGCSCCAWSLGRAERPGCLHLVLNSMGAAAQNTLTAHHVRLHSPVGAQVQSLVSACGPACSGHAQ